MCRLVLTIEFFDPQAPNEFDFDFSVAKCGLDSIVVGLVISLSDQLDTSLVNDLQNCHQGGQDSPFIERG
jgi:hypothetical protein